MRGDQLRRHVELEANPVARLPAAAEGKVLARLDGAVHRLAVGGHFGAGRPSRDAEIKGEFARSLGIQSEIDVAFPRVAGLLSDLQPGAVFEAPVEIGALEEVSVDAILARAVEVSWQGPERALDIGRAAEHVVPRIADGAVLAVPVGVGFAGGFQRIGIAIQRPIERHADVDRVIEGALHDVGKARITRRSEHAPVPHEAADGGARFGVRP